jgi:hypothetical protein
VTTEQNPRDRLFDPDSDTADLRDRDEFGPAPVEETEDTIREPEAHRPRAADEDEQTSQAIAEEGAAASDEADRDPVDRVADRGDDAGAEVADRPNGAVATSNRSDADRDLDRPGEQVGEQPAVADVPTDTGTAGADRGEPLLSGSEADQLRTRWHEVQHEFVDDPQRAVDEAAKLVALAADRVTSMLRDQVGALDETRTVGSANDGEPATEQLRIVMQRYHVLLDRVLAV